MPKGETVGNVVIDGKGGSAEAKEAATGVAEAEAEAERQEQQRQRQIRYKISRIVQAGRYIHMYNSENHYPMGVTYNLYKYYSGNRLTPAAKYTYIRNDVSATLS